MTDPLSISTGVVGLIGFAIQSTQTVTDCYNSYKGQDADRSRTLENLEKISVTLQSLEDVLKNNPFQGNKGQSRQIIEQNMVRCFRSIHDLENKWGNIAQNRFRRQVQRVTYLFRKNKLAELYKNTAEICARLSFDLQGLQLECSALQHQALEELKHQQLKNETLQLKKENTQRLSEVLKWLDAPDARTTHVRSRQKYLAGTGEWFVNGDEFSNWLKTPNSFLWVHGVSGSGKSVLFSTAIHHISQVGKDAGLAFFYFGSSKQSASAMLRALLFQLLLQGNENDRGKDLDQLSSPYEAEAFPLDDFIACLHRIAERLPNIYILLDALNECPQFHGRISVLDTIATMRQWGLPALHVLVTSHDAPDIRHALNPQAGQDVTMKNPGVDKDIHNYIHYQLTTDPNLDQWKHDHAEIHAALAKRAQGLFLYVASQLQKPLKEVHLKCDRDAVLQDLPLDMQESYERLLRCVGEKNTKSVRRIMTLLCYSNRPLTVGEICHALAVSLEKPSRLDLRARLLTENGLRKICGGLIEIIQTNMVISLEARFVKTPVVNIAHSLVQHYLESDAIRRKEVAAFAIDRGSANREIVQICLVYLKSALADETTGQEKIEKFPFALFAAMEWFHYYAACQDKDSGLKNLAFDLFHDGKGGCFTAWIQLHDVDYAFGNWPNLEQVMTDRGPPIYYASLLGLDDIADMILETGSDINIQGGRYGNALQAASSKGHAAVVQILLKHHADVNIQSGQYGTALQAASSKGYTEVVDVLLSHKADVNIHSGETNTALQAASSSGHKDVAQQVLDHGAQVRPKTLSEELEAASVRGDEKRVEELLNVGQEISNEHVQVAIDTALLRVSFMCHENAVKLLLKKGANVNARDGNLGNPLYAASLTQREILHWAAYQCCLEVDIHDIATENLTTGNAREASFMATTVYEKVSRERIFAKTSALAVKNMFKNGCPADLKFMNTSTEDSAKVVEILLANGADVNAKDGKYDNALQAASHIGNETVVKILLDHGADVNAQGGFYGSALIAALVGEHSGVEQILRDHQANIARRNGAEPAEVSSEIQGCP